MTDQASYPVTFAGRDIAFRAPIAGQLIILRRRLMRLQQQAAETTDDTVRLELGNQLIVDTLNVVESLIVNQEDVEFLEQAMLAGKVDHVEVMSVLGMKFEETKPAKKVTKRAAPAKGTTGRARPKR